MEPTQAEIAEMDELVREADQRQAWAEGVTYNPDAQNEEFDEEDRRHHLAHNPITDRYETGGDEIEFADEGTYCHSDEDASECELDDRERALDEVLDADERNGINR